MNLLFLMIPMALILGGLFLFGFIWSVRQGQLDDLETPAHRALFEDTIKSEDQQNETT